MWSQEPGLFTSVIAAMVMPRKTSRETRRVDVFSSAVAVYRSRFFQRSRDSAVWCLLCQAYIAGSVKCPFAAFRDG